MERGSLLVLINLNISENGKIISSVEKEYILGRMEGSITANGWRTVCMAMEISCGRMGGGIRGSMSEIRRKDMVFILGLMGESMMESGRMGSSMGLEDTPCQMASHAKENGKTEAGLHGLRRLRKIINEKKCFINCIYIFYIIILGILGIYL